MSIPISQIVQINPGVLSAAGSAVDLNGLILTKSTYAPIGTVQQFASATDVGAYFGLTSIEYDMASIYFSGYENCTKTPGILYIAQYPDVAVAGYLRGGSLKSMTLTELKALSGTLTVTVDGGSPKTSSTINLSAATSFSNAATLIAAGFTALGATVTFDTVQSAFVFTSSTTGATSSLTFATGTLATSLKLTSATSAVVSAGSAAVTPAAFMAGILLINQNWALFATTWEPDTAGKEEWSDWAATTNDRFGYVGWDSDVNATVAGNTTTWGYYLQSNTISGSVPVYGNYTHAAFVLGYAASLDFDRLNGRATLAFKRNSQLLPSVENGSQAAALKTNGYNFYGQYANAKETFNFLNNGAVSGEWKWLDTYLDQIWLNSNLQLSLVNLLLSVGSIPYNAQGYSLVEAACLDPINAALNFGAIRVGVTLSESQKAQIKFALGFDASTAIYAKGFYLQITPATAQIRVQRASPSITLYWADGGSIQQLTVASITIQ